MHLDVKREDPKKKRNYSIKPSNAMQSNAALIASVLAQKQQAPKPISIRASMAAVIRASIHAPGKPKIADDMQAVLNMPTMADKSRKQATK